MIGFQSGANLTEQPQIQDLLAQQSPRRDPVFAELAERSDRWSIFDPGSKLGASHRWNDSDVGKHLVAIERPDADGKGLVIEVTLISLFEDSVVELRVDRARWITSQRGGISKSEVIPTDSITNTIILDANVPFLPTHSDQIDALFGYGFCYNRLRTLNALQSWAFQEFEQ